MDDIENAVDKFEGAKDALAKKTVSIFGYRISYSGLVVAGGILSSALGALYAGFLMWQKIEEVANLDVGAFEQRMNMIDQRIEDQKSLIDSLSKNLTTTTTNFWTLQERVEGKISSYDAKLDRFEIKVEDTKAELEDKLQKALDNPLSGN